MDLLGPLLKNEYTEEIYNFPEQDYGTVYKTIIQPNIEKEQISPKTSSFRGFLYIPINLSDTTKTHEISTVTNT